MLTRLFLLLRIHEGKIEVLSATGSFISTQPLYVEDVCARQKVAWVVRCAPGRPGISPLSAAGWAESNGRHGLSIQGRQPFQELIAQVMQRSQPGQAEGNVPVSLEVEDLQGQLVKLVV